MTSELSELSELRFHWKLQKVEWCQHWRQMCTIHIAFRHLKLISQKIKTKVKHQQKMWFSSWRCKLTRSRWKVETTTGTMREWKFTIFTVMVNITQAAEMRGGRNGSWQSSSTSTSCGFGPKSRTRKIMEWEHCEKTHQASVRQQHRKRISRYFNLRLWLLSLHVAEQSWKRLLSTLIKRSEKDKVFWPTAGASRI